MNSFFAKLVTRLVAYHYSVEKRHFEELNGDWLENIPGSIVNRTDRFYLKSQAGGTAYLLIDLNAKKSVLFQGDDAGQLMTAFGCFSHLTDEMFDRLCSDYTDVMQPELAGETGHHIYSDLVKLNAACPVTPCKVVCDDDLLQSLKNLLAYGREDEARSFEEIFSLKSDVDDMTLKEVLSFRTNGQRFPHIYQVIRYLEREIDIANSY